MLSYASARIRAKREVLLNIARQLSFEKIIRCGGTRVAGVSGVPKYFDVPRDFRLLAGACNSFI